ncbi:MAG: thiamine-phosphate kinase [Epsilonproteobacteria bacterium]|nr:thiamine-phosphate kinase [Campylobacterota bacterium]
MNREDYLIKKLSSSYIGDDGAVIDDKVYSMDAFFEGVHFKREWMSLKQIARKAMLVNISDAIAMNAKPQYALITLSLPSTISISEIDEIVEALHLTAKEYDCEIIGGDTIAGERLDFSITIVSESKSPLTRKGLKVGDILAYTGHIGESKRDLKRLFVGEKVADGSKFMEPILRQEFVHKAQPYLRAGMDISDGLYCDTNKLLDQNNLGYKLLTIIDDDDGLSGEEYEMLVAFDPSNMSKVLEISKQTKTPLTLFAEVKDNGERFECIGHHFS